MEGKSNIAEQFCMLLKISWYQLKLYCYKFRMLNVIFKVTTKKISIEYTPQNEKGIKMCHYK